MNVEKPAGSFGIAIVSGVDPAGATSHEQAEMNALLATFGVICLRQPRPLSEDELRITVEWFGPVKSPVGRTKSGDLLRYSPDLQNMDSGRVLTDEWKQQIGDRTFGGLDPQRPGLFETWHVDDTFAVDPAAATALHARELPPSGGGPTCFLDMRAALALLDASTRARIELLDVVYAYDNEDAFFPPRRRSTGPSGALVDAVHPLVRTHPVAGTRALFVDLDRAKHIDGMAIDQGRALLRQLQEHAETQAPQCEHAWNDHDVVLWDNASVQHRAGGNFTLGEPRRFWRHLIAGPPPVR